MLNPQQSAFKEAYLNPESETFGNAFKSALAAGFSEDYATDITSAGTDWFKEILGDLKLLQKAEKVLDRSLDFIEDEPGKAKIAQDSAKFIAETLGKNKFSKRSELTGKDGKDLPTPILASLASEIKNGFTSTMPPEAPTIV